jgi:hypothetical protein
MPINDTFMHNEYDDEFLRNMLDTMDTVSNFIYRLQNLSMFQHYQCLPSIVNYFQLSLSTDLYCHNSPISDNTVCCL